MGFQGINHIIIVGWSEKARAAIQEIIKIDQTINIVVIGNDEKPPITDRRLIYIRGNSTDEEILLRANLPKSNYRLQPNQKSLSF
ncbi:NAD-binding protein [Domibacillus sp. A3M-37]|uniref:NAD-binding protein n=1 Tax=Domibacillus sp. A3M-37 TaxID=2962037 RepID=UPI0020B75B2A|nr:NAD-binding protein [Domibacillus sp. A3M-37]MCP3764885.1 NAD-binding protein [Domibacillus sp. A3M-37]